MVLGDQSLEQQGHLADQITAASLAKLEALLRSYSPAEKAAFLEGVIVGAFQAGRIEAFAEISEKT